MAERIQPHYREMAKQIRADAEASDGVQEADVQAAETHSLGTANETQGVASETQEELSHMTPGARWSLEATERVYNRGGNQGEFMADRPAEP